MKKVLMIFTMLLLSLTLVSCSVNKFDDHYLVVFYTSSTGEHVESAKVDKGLTVEKPDDPLSEEAIFDGWYTDTTYSEEFDFSKVITESTTIFAKWIYPIFTIEYSMGEDGINDPNNPSEYTVKQGSVRVNSASREGYMFSKWVLAGTETTINYIDLDLVHDLEEDAKIELEAVWTLFNYSIKYNLSGGKWGEGYTRNDYPRSYNIESNYTDFIPSDVTKHPVNETLGVFEGFRMISNSDYNELSELEKLNYPFITSIDNDLMKEITLFAFYS